VVSYSENSKGYLRRIKIQRTENLLSSVSAGRLPRVARGPISLLLCFLMQKTRASSAMRTRTREPRATPTIAPTEIPLSDCDG